MNTKNLEGRMKTSQTMKGTGLIALGTFSTRLLGFVREIMAAAFFGTGILYDAFLVAFAVPNLFRRVLGEEMFERAFLPPFKRLSSEGQDRQARVYLRRIWFFVCACLIAVTILLFIWLPQVVHLLAPGLSEQGEMEALSLARWMLPFLFLIGTASLQGAILLFSDRKLLFAMAPALTNAAIIIVLLVAHQHLSIMAMVVAWLIGAAAAVLVQLPAVIQVFRALPAPDPEDHTEIAPAVRQGGHILLSSITTKAVEIVDRAIASFIGAGAISSLYFGFRIVHLPFSILSLALSRSIAPEFSRLRGLDDREGTQQLLAFGLEANTLLLAPIIAFMMMFSSEVVSLLYGYGNFGAESVERTSLAFFYYALAILPMGFIALLNRLYASFEDNRLPLLAAVLGGGCNIALDLVLYQTPLKQGGIALASAIGLSLQAAIMLCFLHRFRITLAFGRLVYTSVRTLIGLSVMILVMIALRSLLPSAGSLWPKVFFLAFAAVVSFGVYAFTALILWPRNRPDKVRLILTGGGTGGHVYPALAIHKILNAQGLIGPTLFLGVRDRAEEIIVPRSGLPIRYISSAPYAGGSPIAKLRSLTIVARGVLESLVRIARFRPHLVLATGGYVSAPVIIAAFLLKPFLRLKIVIEEQNLVPGILNKVASLLADVVLISFRESAYFIWSNRCVYSGYPVREEYLEAIQDRREVKRQLGLPEDSFLVLISGGSMGSRSINRVTAASITKLAQLIPNLYVVHGIGMAKTEDYDAVADTAQCLRNIEGLQVDAQVLRIRDRANRIVYQGFEYLHNMSEYQRAADLVVSRAGAGSLAEILSLGKAAVVIPKRGLPGDHQELNAIGIAEEKATEVVFERRDPGSGIDIVDPDLFVEKIAGLAGDAERLRQLEHSAHTLAFRKTEARITNAVEAVLMGEEPDFIPAIIEPPFVRFHRQFDNLIRYLDTSQPNSMYRSLYDIKIHEYLASPDYLIVNRAIKLIGALRRTDLYPVFYRDFDRYHGFQKRNCLEALTKAPEFESEFVDLIAKGLSDSYYEVRRAAIVLYTTFNDDIETLPRAPEFHRDIVALISRRFESFEVKAAAIRAAVNFLGEAEFITLASRFLAARNVRLREAVLDAVENALSQGRFEDRDRLRRFIKGMLITTSQFRPEFTVRERFVKVIQMLEQ